MTELQWLCCFYAFMWFVASIASYEAWARYHPKEDLREKPPRFLLFFMSFFWGIIIPLIILTVTYAEIKKTGAIVEEDDDYM